MRSIILLTILFLTTSASAEELQIKANSFDVDEKAGISNFSGDVRIKKGEDELNATKVTIYTDKEHQPTKFVADGNVSFYIHTKKGSIYKGKAQKVVHVPKLKEYQFFKDVVLQQIDDKKEIIGDEVVLKTNEGKAYAKGAHKEPVIMIFKIKEDEK